MSRWRMIGVVMAMVVVVAGCRGSQELSYIADVKGNRWSRGVVVDVPNLDTLAQRKISIFLKHQPYERLDSVGVNIYVVAPDSVIYTERRTLHIGCQRGESVMAHIHKVLYRDYAVLDQQGIYRFYIFPTSEVMGIEGVGISIE